MYMWWTFISFIILSELANNILRLLLLEFTWRNASNIMIFVEADLFPRYYFLFLPPGMTLQHILHDFQVAVILSLLSFQSWVWFQTTPSIMHGIQ